MRSKKDKADSARKTTISLGQWIFVVGGLFTIVTFIGAANSVDELPPADGYIHFWLRIPFAYWEIYLGFLAVASVMLSIGYFSQEDHRSLQLDRVFSMASFAGLFLLFGLPVLEVYLNNELEGGLKLLLETAWHEHTFAYVCSIALVVVTSFTLLSRNW